MSADFRPIDHILANISLRYEGKINEFMMEKPYMELIMEGDKVIPINNKECCERFPYVSFFNQNINKMYPEYKDNPDYIDKMSALEKDLRQIVNHCWDSFNKGSVRGDKILDKAFDNLSGRFPYLEDFILSEKEFAFSYDSTDSYKLFADRFMSEFYKGIVAYDIKWDLDKYPTDSEVYLPDTVCIPEKVYVGFENDVDSKDSLISVIEDAISDYLTDRYDYCHDGFSVRGIKEYVESLDSKDIENDEQDIER